MDKIQAARTIASDPTADARARCQRYWRHEAMVAEERAESVCLTNRSEAGDEPGGQPDRTR